MATFYTKEADLVQWDLIDGTFDLPILTQLRGVHYAILTVRQMPPHVVE